MAKKRKSILKKKNNNKIYLFIIGILLFLSLVFIFYIKKINILPAKYFFPLLLVTITIILILSLGMIFFHKKSIKIIFTGISIIGILGFSYANYSAFNTLDVLNGMNIDYKSHNYSVLVLKNSNYKNIDDLKDKKVGYYDNGTSEIDKSLSKIDVKVNYISYSNLEELSQDLLNKKIDAILLEDSYRAILDDKDDSKDKRKDFTNLTKIIYQFSIKFETEIIVKDTDTTKDTFAIYISGIDTYGAISSVSRSDVNMVVVVNPTTHQILMISIPRDYYVQLHGKIGYKDKLTHAGIYGVETSVKTLEDLLEIDINYYVKVNFTSLIKVIDSIGGVDVYSDYSFTSKDRFNYKKGYNRVNGKEALSFVRERKSLPGGDRQRIKNQQAMIDAIFRKCINPSIIVKYNSLLNSLDGSFISNMPSERLISLIKKQLDTNSNWTLTSYSLDGTDSRQYTYSYSGKKLYVMIPNEETVKQAKNLISDVYNDKKLKASYADSSSNVNSVTKVPIKKEESKEQKYNTYIVTFDSNGGSEVEKQIINESQFAKEPNAPEKEDHEFLGWFYKDELFDFNFPVNENIILIAKWNPILEEIIPEESEE